MSPERFSFARGARITRDILEREGVRGLYKGIAVNLIKSPVATAVSFAVNDSVKEALLRRGLV